MSTPTLTDATVTRRADEVALTWTVDGDLEDSSLNPWLLSVMLVGGEEGPIHQIGFRYYDGQPQKAFVFDFVGGQNYYTPQVQPERTGNKWTAVFPVEDSVARSGKWTSSLAFDDDGGTSTESDVEGTF